MMNDEIGFGRKVLQVIEEAGLSYEHTPSGIDTMNVIVELNSFIEHEQEIYEREKVCHLDTEAIEKIDTALCVSLSLST